MKNVVIVDSVRTGLAKSHRGGFNMTRPDNMLAHIINALLERNPNLPPEAVEDIIMGCGNPEGAQGHNIGRNAAVLSIAVYLIAWWALTDQFGVQGLWGAMIIYIVARAMALLLFYPLLRRSVGV